MAAIDLALAFVEADIGRDAAMMVARYVVVFLRRSGGQSQFSAQMRAQIAERPVLREVQQLIADRPDADLSVEPSARRANLRAAARLGRWTATQAAPAHRRATSQARRARATPGPGTSRASRLLAGRRRPRSRSSPAGRSARIPAARCAPTRLAPYGCPRNGACVPAPADPIARAEPSPPAPARLLPAVGADQPGQQRVGIQPRRPPGGRMAVAGTGSPVGSAVAAVWASTDASSMSVDGFQPIPNSEPPGL